MKLTRRYEKMTPEKRPQDPSKDGTGLTFATLVGRFQNSNHIVTLERTRISWRK
jgi:hypothetical protein